MKKLNIKTKTNLMLPASQLHPIQGDLKDFTEENREKCRLTLLKDGVTFALHVWKEQKKVKGKPVTTWWIIDGHGRVEVIMEDLVKKEGYEEPSLPCVEVPAKSFAEAKELVMNSSSSFHTVNKQGLFNYMQETGMKFEDLRDRFNLADVDMAAFKVEFFPPTGKDAAPKGKPEDVNFEAYLDKAIKPVTLYYAADDYTKIVAAMDTLLGSLDVKDYSALIWRLVFEKVRPAKA